MGAKVDEVLASSHHPSDHPRLDAAVINSTGKAQNETDRTSCFTCGAPLDTKNLVSDSGWAEAPPLRDMTEFRFSNSTCQIEGEIVPVAEMALAQGDAVFFEHHVMLWKEPHVPMSAMNTGGGMKRMLGGMPHVLSIAHGPGRIALSRDATGEVVVLPLHPEMELDVREHAFLAGTHSLNYSFVRIKGLTNLLHGGEGMYLDRFVTQNQAGLLLLHGYGNVFQKTLAPGEQILIEPGGFLYKDSTVTMNTVKQSMRTGLMGGHNMYLAEMTGPGRIGIQPGGLIWKDPTVQMWLHFEYPRGQYWFSSARYQAKSVWLTLQGPGRVAIQSVFKRPEMVGQVTNASSATSHSW